MSLDLDKIQPEGELRKEIHRLGKQLDSLQLELLAEQHAHRKDNEFHQHDKLVHMEQLDEINKISIRLGVEWEELDDAIRDALDFLVKWNPHKAADILNAVLKKQSDEREARK